MATQVQDNGLANVIAAWVAYASRPRYMQWGEGSGQAVTDNAIDNAGTTTEARTAGTSSQVTTTVTGDTYRVVGTITATGSYAITELGVFDAAGAGSPPTGGNMDLYGDFAAINVTPGDAILFTFDVIADQA